MFLPKAVPVPWAADILAADLRLIELAIQRETVTGLRIVHEARNAAEAEAGEVLELIVGL